jgi:predicted phage baseplate assembly protein
VGNLDAARGGVDAETIANAKIRGPLTLRSGDRAVTVADFERLTLEADRSVARARCVPPSNEAPPSETLSPPPVRLLIVPWVDVEPEALRLDHLALPPEVVRRVIAHLDQRRLLTTRVQLDEPSYTGVMIVTKVRATAGLRPEAVREAAEHALYTYVNPLVGGRDHRGWPFGTPLIAGDLHALLQTVHGIESVQSLDLFAVDLRALTVSDVRQDRIDSDPDTLFMSFRHTVVIE